ncbi:hypothetical protein K523DRAFT_324622 [Schizophyllum commune Tattone D]|nr:hypothetical protein K523DRAFT_324622 [Schizophyllum commune Tattone D]
MASYVRECAPSRKPFTFNNHLTNRELKPQIIHKKFAAGPSPSASDDTSWSPKTNSASPAGCEIASLA